MLGQNSSGTILMRSMVNKAAASLLLHFGICCRLVLFSFLWICSLACHTFLASLLYPFAISLCREIKVTGKTDISEWVCHAFLLKHVSVLLWRMSSIAVWIIVLPLKMLHRHNSSDLNKWFVLKACLKSSPIVHVTAVLGAQVIY